MYVYFRKPTHKEWFKLLQDQLFVDRTEVGFLLNPLDAPLQIEPHRIVDVFFIRSVGFKGVINNTL